MKFKLIAAVLLASMLSCTTVKADYIDDLVAQYQIEMEMVEAMEDKEAKILRFNQVNTAYAFIGSADTVYDCFNSDELMWMWRMIETETYQQPFDAKVNVANVLLNRINYDGECYPEFKNKSVEDTVRAKNQFAYGRKNISASTKLALEYAFVFEDTTDGALFFNSMKKKDKWNGANYIFTDVSGHHFYGEN